MAPVSLLERGNLRKWSRDGVIFTLRPTYASTLGMENSSACPAVQGRVGHGGFTCGTGGIAGTCKVVKEESWRANPDAGTQIDESLTRLSLKSLPRVLKLSVLRPARSCPNCFSLTEPAVPGELFASNRSSLWSLSVTIGLTNI